MPWKVFFASAAGKNHLDGNAPCQDSGHYRVVHGVFIGVVCDGAGSASDGREGADFFATRLTERIAGSVESGQWAALDIEAMRQFLQTAIHAVREQLQAHVQDSQRSLRDFACTLVGCVSARAGGCFFHIGDGYAVYRGDAGSSVLSHPENGEYADQTYFVTDEQWREHLRVTPLGAVNRGGLIGLMSDGTSPFAIDRLRTGFFGPFIDPIVAYLEKIGEADGNRALLGVLADEKTHSITTDDKTLLLALAG